MKTVSIGIDISKEWLDYSICEDLTQDRLQSKRVNNSIAGIHKMINNCQSTGSSLWFCFEHTGNYGLLLASQLHSKNLTYSMVPGLEIIRSCGITRGKDDKVDAKRIAQYAATHSHKLKPTVLPSNQLLMIRSLLTYRNQWVKRSRQVQTQKKDLKMVNRILNLQDLIEDYANEIRLAKRKIKETDQKIMNQINSNEELKLNFQKITSIKGIGPVIAFHMLVYTNNFQLFCDPRKFNCYAGLAPFSHSSGSSYKGKTKTSKLRNKKMKALLFNGSNSAVQYDQELKAYFKKKINEGKARKVVINAVACKLVSRMFAVVKRDEAFVNLVR